jgi:hypothetical protein
MDRRIYLCEGGPSPSRSRSSEKGRDEAIPRNAQCPVSGRFRLFLRDPCRSAIRLEQTWFGAPEVPVPIRSYSTARTKMGLQLEHRLN